MAPRAPRPAPRRPAQTIAWVLAGLAAALLAGEATARSLGPHLSEPDRYGDRARAVKVAQMDGLDGGCADIAVVGNSMARDGIDPVAFADADPHGRTVYNASLDAASPELLESWLVAEVLPRARPATVLIAISTVDLNREAPAVGAALEAWQTSRAGRDDLLGSTERSLAGQLALLEHRSELRDPEELGDAFARLWRGQGAERTTAGSLPGVLGPLGEGQSRRDLVHRGDPVSERFVAEQLLADLDIGDDAADRITGLVDAAGRGGAEVALVVLPVTDDFVALHPAGAADLQQASEAVDEAARRTSAHLVDLSAFALDDEDFADTHHLNANGAEQLSRALPEALADAGVAAQDCPR